MVETGGYAIVAYRIRSKVQKQDPAEVRKVLAALEAASPTRLYLDDDGDYTVPLFVPINVERAAVLEELRKQAKEVALLLKGFGASALTFRRRGYPSGCHRDTRRQ